MVEPTRADLRKQVETVGGYYSRSQGERRQELHTELTIAKIAHYVARSLEDCAIPATQEQADYICSIVSSRIGAVEWLA